MSYHIKRITKGILGELSKIQEELDECKDAEEQGNRIMLVLELSDLLGAVELVAEKQGFSLHDLITMKEATRRAFESGYRLSKEESL